MKQNSLKDFFISYTKADLSWAEWIAWQLEEEGYSTVLQAWDFRPGSNFVLDMHIATSDAQRTIAVLSPDYLGAPYAQSEWATAFAEDPMGEKGAVLSVQVRQCELRGLLRSIVYIDLVGLKEQDAREALLKGVQSVRLKPTTSPEFPAMAQRVADKQPRFPGVFPYFWNISYRRNPFFTGREEVLTHLNERLRVGKSVALVQPQALTGLGGIGKTQTVVEYVYRYYSNYPQAILWVRADSRDLLVSDFISVAGLLKLPEGVEQDQNLVVEGVKRWMKEQSGWLLVIDNVDDLEMVKHFIPSAHRGHILLTTRVQVMGEVAQRVEIEKMKLDEGALFLLQRTMIIGPDDTPDHALDSDRATAREISALMDGLPLALDQAGAYIEEAGCGLAGYLDLYKSQRTELLKRRGKANSAHPQSVTTTFSLSFEKIRQANSAAAELVKLCAFLSPDAIPEEIITRGALHLGRILRSAATSPIKLDAAIAELLKFSLVQRDPDGKNLIIHRLVQSVLVDRMDKRSRRLWAERAVRAVNHVFPDVAYEVWDQCLRYLPHVQVCQMLIERYELAFPEAARLLHQAGSYLTDRADYLEAEAFLQQALAIRERVLGHDHPDTASSLAKLADLYSNRNKDELAEPLFQEALAIRERVLGHQHLDTARSLSNLAIIYSRRGHDEEVELLFQEILAIREQVLGPSHPETASSLNNLAALYSKRGKDLQAEPLFQRALAIREQVLGPNHPETASSLENLAIVYSKRGKDQQAEPLLQRALSIREQVLGHDHLYTVSSRNNLADLYRKCGKYEQADSLLQRSLPIRKQELEPDNPDTMSSRNNLTDLYGKRNKEELTTSPLQQTWFSFENILESGRPGEEQHAQGVPTGTSPALDPQSAQKEKPVSDQPGDRKTSVVCIEPGAILDEELLAYIAGERLRPRVQEHLSRCQHCSAKLAEFRHIEFSFTSKLYRWDCPSNQVLGEYQLGLLNNELVAAVRMHLSRCELCTAEVATLTEFLANDPMLVESVSVQPSSQPKHTNTLQEEVRLLDRLRDRSGTQGQHIVATLLPPNPRLAYQRDLVSTEGWPRRYTAEDFSISIQVERDEFHADLSQLIGFVTRKGANLGMLQGIPVVLSSQTNIVYTKNIDELGNFVFSSVAPATYTLELQLPDSTIVIEPLSIALQG